MCKDLFNVYPSCLLTCRSIEIFFASTRACSSVERALSLSLPSFPPDSLPLSLYPPLALFPSLSIPRSLILTHIHTGADNFAVASSPAMRAVAGRLRMELAQASDIPPDDMTSDSVRQRARAKAWHAALQQQWGAPRTFGYAREYVERGLFMIH